MPNNIGPIEPTQDIAAGLGPMAATPSTSTASDAEFQGFIDLLREPFNIGEWNDRNPTLVLYLRSIHISEEENAPCQ